MDMYGEGSSVITARGYKITFAGDYSKICFNTSVSDDGSVFDIQAIDLITIPRGMGDGDRPSGADLFDTHDTGRCGYNPSLC